MFIGNDPYCIEITLLYWFMFLEFSENFDSFRTTLIRCFPTHKCSHTQKKSPNHTFSHLSPVEGGKHLHFEQSSFLHLKKKTAFEIRTILHIKTLNAVIFFFNNVSSCGRSSGPRITSKKPTAVSFNWQLALNYQ